MPHLADIWIGMHRNLTVDEVHWADNSRVKKDTEYFPFTTKNLFGNDSCVRSLQADNYTWTIGSCSAGGITGVCYSVPGRFYVHLLA